MEALNGVITYQQQVNGQKQYHLTVRQNVFALSFKMHYTVDL